MTINPLQVEAPAYMTEDLRIFEDGVAKFLAREAVPHAERYIANHQVELVILETETIDSILAKLVGVLQRRFRLLPGQFEARFIFIDAEKLQITAGAFL